MKKYNTPEIETVIFESQDVIAVTGSGNFLDFITQGTRVEANDYFID